MYQGARRSSTVLDVDVDVNVDVDVDVDVVVDVNVNDVDDDVDADVDVDVDVNVSACVLPGWPGPDLLLHLQPQLQFRGRWGQRGSGGRDGA
jgi:hypothetical protein